MPYRTGKNCSSPGCKGIAKYDQKYCDKHQYLIKEEKKNYRRQYNKSNPQNPFYASTRWKKARAFYRLQHPLCEMCQREGVISKAELVDHKVPLTQGGAELEFENFQSLCIKHHLIKTKRE